MLFVLFDKGWQYPFGILTMQYFLRNNYVKDISIKLLKATLQYECILASDICCELPNHTMLFHHLSQRFISQLHTSQNSAELFS